MRTKFRLIVHESTGQKYEDLFVKIMSYADVNFKPVKAHGNIGDRGNDGWSSVSGRYYQSYAPDDLPANTENAINKMKADFLKLKSFWDGICPVKEFVFVVNDKFLGVSPHITSAINEIKAENNLSNVEIWGASDLERILFYLSSDQISQIVGESRSDVQPHDNFYMFLVDSVTKKLHLTDWMRISDNLIANSIEDSLIDSFSEFTVLVFRTSFPGKYPLLDSSIAELCNRVERLVEHFTSSNNAYLIDNSEWWKIDRRWKRDWLQQHDYDQKYDECERWRKQLFNIHSNLVHALNLFANEVRQTVKNDYFMNQSFVVNDSLGTYNQMQGYQYIPSEFVAI